MTNPPRVALSIAMTPPRALARTTQQRCHALLRTQTPAAKRVPRWEWLVYAASVVICSGYLMQMTLAWDGGATLAKLHVSETR